MKWVTRQKARVDRIACPWLIKRFVDKDAEFLFVPAGDVIKVAHEHGAVPFDTPGVELAHYREGGKEYVSFDAIVRKYAIDDPAVRDLAWIVRGADASIDDAPLESAGLEAAAIGFSGIARDDSENIRLQFPLYDALYQYCKARLSGSGTLRHATGRS